MKLENKKLVSTVALLIVALVWGTSYAIIKDTLEVVSPLTLMTIRYLGSALILSFLFINRLLKVDWQDMKHGAIIGVFMFGAFSTLAIGIQYTTASKQSFIIGAYVLIVPFLSWLINKKLPDKYAIVGACLAVIGLGLLTLGGIDGLTIGDIIAFACSTCFAFHMVSIEKYCHKHDPILLTIIQFWVAALLLLIFALCFEDFSLKVFYTSTMEILYLIIACTVFAFVVQNIAQRHISSTSTALILTLESAFGSIFAIMYLKEEMSSSMIIGCLIVLMGIITQETKWKFLRGSEKKHNL